LCECLEFSLFYFFAVELVIIKYLSKLMEQYYGNINCEDI